MIAKTSSRFIVGFLLALIFLGTGAFWLLFWQPSIKAGRLRETFSEKVGSVFERKCVSCHGVSERTYLSQRDHFAASGLWRFPTDEAGKIRSERIQDLVYRAATYPYGVEGRSKGQSPLGQESEPLTSPLLRLPLVDQLSGGEPHPEVFTSLTDDDYITLRDWISDELIARDKKPIVLTKEEVFFANKVVPILERKVCFGCHLPTAFNDLKLDPGIPALEGRYTPGIHRNNRIAMLGENIKWVHCRVTRYSPVRLQSVFRFKKEEFFTKGEITSLR
ncbi:MAG: hypothetical protein KDD43_02685 [Bdellovibrionales bacterium]|nr:hypothetical protein [Bdellovibrionales bacterium]